MKRELKESVLEELMKLENLFQEHSVEFRDVFVSGDTRQHPDERSTQYVAYYVSTGYGFDVSFVVHFNESFDEPEHWIVAVGGCGLRNRCLVVCEDGVGSHMEYDYISMCYLDFLRKEKNEAFSAILKRLGLVCEWPNPVAGLRNNNFYGYLKMLKR